MYSTSPYIFEGQLMGSVDGLDNDEGRKVIGSDGIVLRLSLVWPCGAKTMGPRHNWNFVALEGIFIGCAGVVRAYSSLRPSRGRNTRHQHRSI